MLYLLTVFRNHLCPSAAGLINYCCNEFFSVKILTDRWIFGVKFCCYCMVVIWPFWIWILVFFVNCHWILCKIKKFLTFFVQHFFLIETFRDTSTFENVCPFAISVIALSCFYISYLAFLLRLWSVVCAGSTRSWSCSISVWSLCCCLQRWHFCVWWLQWTSAFRPFSLQAW